MRSMGLESLNNILWEKSRSLDQELMQEAAESIFYTSLILKVVFEAETACRCRLGS